MIKFNFKTGILLVIMGTTVALPAFAQLESGDKTVKMFVNTSAAGGGALTAEGIVLKDSKGDPIGGMMSGEGYVLQTGLMALILQPALVTAMGIPEGTLPLYISRVGANIQITWEAAYANPQIFMLTGDGTGSYTSGEGWTKIAENSSIVPGLPTELKDILKISGNILTYEAQVGGGTSEAYFKGIQAGVIENDPHPKISGANNLQAAMAVGKVNVGLVKGDDALISTPFYPQNGDRTFDTILGNQLDNTGATIYGYIGGYKPAFREGGLWKGALASYGFDEKRGYWIVGIQNSKVITLVGQVRAGSIDLIGGEDNLIGVPFPAKSTFDKSGLASAITSVDIVYGYSGAYRPAFLENNIWQGALVNLTLMPIRGYWILKQSPGVTTWNYPIK